MDLSRIGKQCQLNGFTPESQNDIDFHFAHCRTCQRLFEHSKRLEERFEKEELEQTSEC